MNPLLLLYQNLEKQLFNYQKMLQMEIDKLTAVRENDIDSLNKITKDEASLLSLLSVFEKQRLGLLANLGFSGYTMSQILPFITDDEYKIKMTKTFNELSSVLNKIKETTTMTQNLAEINLHFSQIVLKSLEEPPEPVLYKSDGSLSSAKEENRYKFKNEKI